MRIKPIFSIIIPARNEEDVIERCLQSILNQTFQDFEIIISNDGSTDRTKELVENFAQNDNNTKILNRNEGHSAAYARNRGAEIAKGKILIFLDADCVITNNFLQKIYEKRNDADAFVVDCFPTKNTLVNYALSGLVVPIVLKKEIYNKNDSNAPMFFTITKKAYDAINGYDENIFYFEDKDFTERFYKNNFKCKYIKDAYQYFELPSTFSEFIRQCKWIAKGINKMKAEKRTPLKVNWLKKSLFLLFPFLFILNTYIFLILFFITLMFTYGRLIQRNKSLLNSFVTLPFLYIKIFVVSFLIWSKKKNV